MSEHDHHGAHPGHAEHTHADHAGEEAGPLLALPPRALWAVGAVGFCALVCEGATSDCSAVYVRESLDASPEVAALAFAAFSATMTIGASWRCSISPSARRFSLSR